MHAEYGDRGLAILGFPCNQFGSQESKSEEVIAEFAKDKGVEFWMSSKVLVNQKGKDEDETADIYKWLKSQSGNKGLKLSWNFCKFLLDVKKEVVTYHDKPVNPFDLKDKIEEILE